jgi:YidC/Oxa1 family membrane protein insertase
MDQKRFILAMVLSAGVLFGWQMFFAPERPEQTTDTQQQTDQTDSKSADGETADGEKSAEATGEESDATQESDGSESAEAAESGESDEPIGQKVMEQAAPERDVEEATHKMASGRMHLTLTNTDGGRVRHVHLDKPKQYQKKGDLLGAFPKPPAHLPFRVGLSEGQLPMPDSPTYEFIADESKLTDKGEVDGKVYSKVVYRYEDPKGRFAIDKAFEIDESKPYVVNFDVHVHNRLDETKLSDALALDIYGYKDPDQETSFLNFRPNEVEGVCQMTGETQRSSISGIEEPMKYDGSEVIWGAIDTRYFLMAAVPLDGAQTCAIEKVDDGYLRTRVGYDRFSVLPGETYTAEHVLFMGPKDIDDLHTVGHNLSNSVNYGMFAFIARPLRWALDYLYKYVGNWGLAIILLTIIIKLLTWPINMKAYRNMEDMKKIQPKLEEVREKYDDDQQRMTEETMKLFRENDVSPMGGCLPMLLQMPILYGLYVMIYYSVELYQADFMLWYTNLAAPDPYYVLPLLMGAVMYVQQGMMGSAAGTTNMQAKVMTKVMPVMFTAFMLFLPSGLVLYYSINLMIGLGQQFYIRGFPWEDDEEAEATT